MVKFLKNTIHERMAGEEPIQKRMAGEESIQERMAGEKPIQERMAGEESIQERMAGEESIQEKVDEEGNKWRKVYFGGGAHFSNWLEQCKELGEVEVEEVDRRGFKCFEDGDEGLYRIWMKVVVAEEIG